MDEKPLRVYWKTIDARGLAHEGELPPIAYGTTMKTVETDLFKEIEKLESVELYLRIKDKDGSGYVATYKKRGEVWIKVYSDNIVSTWFPIVFLPLLLIGVPLIVALICWLNGVK